MTRRIIISLILGLIGGLLAYLLLSEWLYGLVVLVVGALAVFFLVYPPIDGWLKSSRRAEECFRFVNSFIVSYAVSENPEEAYSAAALGLSEEGKEQAESLVNLGVEERLSSLGEYFQAPYFRMFTSLYLFQLEQGGRFLDKAEPLLHEINQGYEDLQLREKEKRKHLVGWAAMWGLSALIIVFVRFALNNNYASVSASTAYVVIGLLYFALAYLGCAFFAYRLAEWKFLKKENSGEKEKV